ncbi:MAG TPA: LLM class F420-dependent oxidoreductase [Acidimicrobiia bacterium]|nr:LLM class F420-dependent oxidoreductase [Acidimicrobiia bacterium]
MKLGLQLGYWFAQPPAGVEEQVAEAERLGFDSAWVAEAYGSDCFTPLAWQARATSSLKWGTAVCQISARTPVATAMTALTLDHLTEGRFMLGLGVSGPQVVEGWYGQPFPKPLERTREYVGIVRQVLERNGPVTNDGPHYPLPYPGGTDLGKPLKSITHPRRADLPILLGAEGPKNVALTAEIADGWLPIFYSPKLDPEYRGYLREGFARPAARRSIDDFEVATTVNVVIDDDVERAADAVRPFLAFYIGGMGAREVNFHFDVFCRMGYEAEATKVQDLFFAGRRDEAVAAIPLAMVEDVALVGPAAKIRDELQAWEETVLTTMLVAGPPEQLRRVAEVVLG